MEAYGPCAAEAAGKCSATRTTVALVSLLQVLLVAELRPIILFVMVAFWSVWTVPLKRLHGRTAA
jgi:hypothetical protein